MPRNLTGFGFSRQITGKISVVDKMVPFLCSPPDSDGKISPFRPRIEKRDCMSDGRAIIPIRCGRIKEVPGTANPHLIHGERKDDYQDNFTPLI